MGFFNWFLCITGNATLLLVVSFKSTSGIQNLMMIFQLTLSTEVFFVLISSLVYLGKFWRYF